MQPLLLAWDARTMSLPAIKFEGSVAERELARRNLSGLEIFYKSLRNLLLRGLNAPTIEAWIEFWQQPEQRASFLDFTRAARRALQEVGIDIEAHRKPAEHELFATLMQAFPARISSFEVLQTRISEISTLISTVIRRKPLRSDNLKPLETQHIRTFNSVQHWIAIGLNSLQLVAEAHLQGSPLEIPEPLIEGILEQSNDFALDALHTAHEGAQLREIASEKVFVTFTSKISPTEDGLGFIGTCEELALITCGEARGEMRKLVVELVIGYLRAEGKRGNLGRVLAASLSTTEDINPGNLSLRILIQDGDLQHGAFVEMGRSRY